MSCLTSKMRVTTQRGDVAVETLETGDLVLTRDNGFQPVRHVLCKHLTGRYLLDNPHLRPVLVARDAFADNLPYADTMITANSRLPVATSTGGMLRRATEELVAVKTMIDHDMIQQIDTVGTDYYLIQFDGHEVIAVNGFWLECFNTADTSLGAVGNAQRLEILEIFPERGTWGRTARPIVARAQVRAGLLRRAR